MENKLIYGIQQIGVGVENADKAFEWYATRLGADVPVFDDSNTATYMAPYMGGNPHKKRAILAMNMQGGSGYEIWQYLDRKPAHSKTNIQLGDLGVNCAFIKTRNIEATYQKLKNLGENILTDIKNEPNFEKSFYLKDPFGNMLKIKEYDSWYADDGNDLGGIFGCSIGVTDIAKSMKLYADILGYDQVIYDKTDIFNDIDGLPNGKSKFRRVLLTHEKERVGGFSKLFGKSQIELIQCLDNKPKKIFKDRYWGDIGFIHLCFDIRNMKALTKECKAKGFPFKVLSAESFDMGDANGHWGYIEDCDGTLIEFVETHKVPLIKQLGLHINLKKRSPLKAVPNWMIKAMALKRVKSFD
ncbi:VOC family protein [Aurantibacter crassamenti]|uniref:VOC family protein n=1 Tax=Aurantibacter crassamenti TaxID=1837375 RepID=UPI0019392C27|nr:VOC family protein [Aurantibacter crassamenti]MBM1108228.1 VOC family protein [Aurantibacter crassamenti]